MKSRYRWFVLALLLSVGSLAQAQEAFRVAFVSHERVLRDAAPAKAALQKIETEFSKRDRDLVDMAARLKGLGERIERDGAVMADTERVRRQREFAELEKEFQRKQREFREDLAQRKNEEIAQLVERANKVIRQIAEQEKYDLIVQDAVYWSPRIDITEKVLRALSAPAAGK